MTSAPILPAPPRSPVVVDAASTLVMAADLAAFAAMLPIARVDEDVVTAASVAACRIMGDSSLIAWRIMVAAIWPLRGVD